MFSLFTIVFPAYYYDLVIDELISVYVHYYLCYLTKILLPKIGGDTDTTLLLLGYLGED